MTRSENQIADRSSGFNPSNQRQSRPVVVLARTGSELGIRRISSEPALVSMKMLSGENLR
jgi:hypothetical protein